MNEIKNVPLGEFSETRKHFFWEVGEMKPNF